APRRGASSPRCACSPPRRPPAPSAAPARCLPPRGGRPRRTTTALSGPSPRPPVPVEELVGARRSPRACGVVRERRPVALPGGDDRVDEQPLLLDLVLAREQGRVAEHGVENEALVRLGHPGAERAAVEEVHVDGADR